MAVGQRCVILQGFNVQKGLSTSFVKLALGFRIEQIRRPSSNEGRVVGSIRNPRTNGTNLFLLPELEHTDRSKLTSFFGLSSAQGVIGSGCAGPLGFVPQRSRMRVCEVLEFAGL